MVLIIFPLIVMAREMIYDISHMAGDSDNGGK
jgi:hypothetical protein